MNAKYEAILGHFAQDDPAADSHAIGALPPRFGLLDSSPDRWATLKAHLGDLNHKSDATTAHKLLFLGRHGEGYHNVGEAKYGTTNINKYKAWDEYWSKLNGDGTLIWGPDPQLTTVGKNQATMAQTAWKDELPHGIPLPDLVYCSPLSRALQTNVITFRGILTDRTHRRMILENCREEYGEHTCDKRASRSFIIETFPDFDTEQDFTENDELWTADVRETKAHAASRAKKVLDVVFSSDANTSISITAHGGIINALLHVLGRPPYGLPTGGILPVVVKCVKLVDN